MRGPPGAAVVVGNKIVVFGGRTGGKVEAEVKPTEVFDGKSWHDAPAIPVPGDHLGAVTDGTYAYAIGGRNSQVLRQQQSSAALRPGDRHSGPS